VPLTACLSGLLSRYGVTARLLPPSLHQLGYTGSTRVHPH
jgi:hypothetical protein